MLDLLKLTELSKRFDIPYQTLQMWSKYSEKNWRHKLYRHLEKIYLNEVIDRLEEQKK